MKEEKAHKDVVIKPQEGFQMQFASSCVDVVFGGGNLGGGKLQPLDSKVLTPNGWSLMKDIRVGSKILTPFDGVANVTAIFPQGEQDVYELITSDGRKCECGIDHLWTIRTTKQMHKYKTSGGKWDWVTTITTGELIKRLEQGKKCFIPLPKAVEFKEKELPIHPYVLGVMIGDGCLTCTLKSTSFGISNVEEDIINKVYELTNSSRIYRQPHSCTKIFFTEEASRYKSYLDEVGLSTHSYDKFIPKIYLQGSIEQRRQLLFGLMDTDGSIELKGYTLSYSFSTTSERLKDDFIELCRSLGYKAKYRIDPRAYKYTKGVAYDIVVMTDDCICSSNKHLDKYNSVCFDNRCYGRTNDHAPVVSIKKKRRTECQCILVDDEKHLYITDDYITTHNSFALVLALAEPLMTDGDFRAVITRRSLQSQKTGGSFVDTFKSIFGDYCSVKTADSPRISFPSGAYCDLTYIDDTNLDKMREQWKGKQIDAICIDEITEMSWEAFSYVQTRNRGRSRTFTGKFFATLNPKRSHWTRKFLDWYIGVDGFIMPDRNGKVRYFYVNGSTVDDVVWGDTKEEVYRKCKIDIDRKLARIGGNFTYENMIKSFVFYQGKLSENKAMLENNPNYIGSVAASGGRMAQAIIEGNFNVDPEEDEKIPIPSSAAQGVFNNNPAVNGDKWVTVDLADYGTDNLVALAWDGFHAYDILILSKSTPRENAQAVKTFAFEHGTAESHIIFDATAGRYFNDYIPDAIPYISLNKPFGLYPLTAMTVKDMCYLRLCKMIENGNLTFDDKLAVQTYTHQNLKYKVTVENEFIEECSVVRFDDMQSGKKRLWNKKKMNQMLGKGRSMDLLDPCAMRMLPCANIEYGNEIQAGYYNSQEERREMSHVEMAGSIYDDTTWC